MIIAIQGGMAVGKTTALKIIEKCAHPSYKADLLSYFNRACALGGQTPHVLREALSWHANFEETGHMLSNGSLAKTA